MKKTKLILALLALLPFSGAFAQTGEIIYRDFEPDLSIHAMGYNDPHDTIRVDLDQDGTVDFKMYIATEQYFYRYVYVTSTWDFRYCYNSIYSHPGIYEDDTIVPYPRWWTDANGCWPLLWWNAYDDYMEFYMGFRKTVDGENYYAWSRIYMTIRTGYNPSHGEYEIVEAYCDNAAYCTIPDYPLRWGQTDILGIEENSETNNAFAVIHPNPTTSLITITGENLQRAEVLNMLGQRIRGVPGKGDELHIDMAALPAGVYFVSITDEEGRKCVRKVVKE